MKKTFRIRLVQPAYNFFQSTQNESLLKSRISSFRRNCCKTLRNSTNGNFHNREALVEFHWYECRSSHTFVRIRRNVRVCKPHFYITDRSECKEKKQHEANSTVFTRSTDVWVFVRTQVTLSRIGWKNDAQWWEGEKKIEHSSIVSFGDCVSVGKNASGSGRIKLKLRKTINRKSYEPFRFNQAS